MSYRTLFWNGLIVTLLTLYLDYDGLTSAKILLYTGVPRGYVLLLYRCKWLKNVDEIPKFILYAAGDDTISTSKLCSFRPWGKSTYATFLSIWNYLKYLTGGSLLNVEKTKCHFSSKPLKSYANTYAMMAKRVMALGIMSVSVITFTNTN